MKTWLLCALCALGLTACMTARQDVITIDAVGTITLNGAPVSVDDVAEGLSHGKVLLEASRETPYQYVVTVMDEIQKAGVHNIAVRSSSR